MKKRSGETERRPHVVVCPQLQTTGADAEHAGKKLLGFKELWEVKILGQVGKLFAQISGFL